MSFIDSTIIVVYLVVLLCVGVYANKRQNDMVDYYVAGKSAGVFSITSLWLSSWIGGAAIMGCSAKAFEMGITAMWFVGANAIGCLLFAFTFSGIIKRIGDNLNQLTYPDFIESRYDSRSRVIATITTIVAYIAYTSSQLVAAGSILHILTGLDLGWSFVIATIIIVVYTSIGGFKAVTYTDWIQFILLIVGVVLVGVPLVTSQMGGISAIGTLPDSYFDIGAWGWPTIISMTVAQIFTFYTSMDSYTRCFAAKDEKTAVKGTVYAAIGIVIIALSTTYLGLAAKVLMPNFEAGNSLLTTLIIRSYPVGIKGLALVGILSAVMSTADICILTASANVTNDIYKRYINKNASQRVLLKVGIASSLVIGTFSAIMAWKMMDIINILFVAFTINSAGLFVPTILGVFWKKGTSRASFISMTLSLVTVLVWYGASSLGLAGIFSAPPLWPGLAVSFVSYLYFSLKGNKGAGESDHTKRFMNALNSPE
ncbi:sodium:solute symporter family protein [Clostridia bacterium]|nr:sodium:solute symporter family protein [Clostridia bacterium]